MPLILREIRLEIDEDEGLLPQKAALMLGMNGDDLRSFRILRQSIDARDKNDVHFKYSAAVSLANASEEIRLARGKTAVYEEEPGEQSYTQGIKPLVLRPVIAGAGPAGLFCALLLSQYGYQPLLIERGRDVDSRAADFVKLCDTGQPEPESNVCFGEGGAGAFSDGKLTTRIKDPRAKTVLELLIAAGAPQDIRYSAKPHMGTENIRQAAKNIRKQIIANGGEVWFGAKLAGITRKEGRLHAIRIHKNGTEETIKTDMLILAAGHSARDTYAMLQDSGIVIEKKPFAIGLRIEHPREWIDQSQYGPFAGHPRLGAAEYRLTSRAGQRGVYTFCMCPGGVVINASTEAGRTAVNGMSFFTRAGQNSNSAIVVTVGTDDLGPDALAGVAFQRQWEGACYALAGGAAAPVQRVEDFIKGIASGGFGPVLPSIQPYAKAADLNACLPDFVAAGIKAGIADFSRRLRGFDLPEAMLTGVETRTSSPVSIPRDENYEAIGCAGLYPCGEGAGHAGGIVSAAVDGLKVAQAVIEAFKPDY
jgi:uncharacterized FAD-dependent dehydrogenase